MFYLSFKKHKRGQGLVEYALILVLVAIVVIAALMVLGPIVGDMFSDINASLLSI
jgi:pilus assembly protein Flp/PilA